MGELHGLLSLLILLIVLFTVGVSAGKFHLNDILRRLINNFSADQHSWATSISFMPYQTYGWHYLLASLVSLVEVLLYCY